MPVEAQPVDPRKTFNFAIEIDGLEVALVEKCNIPTLEAGIVEQSSAGTPHVQKTAGRITVGEITLEKVMPANEADTWAYQWLTSEVRNPRTGATNGADSYKKTISIIHYGNSNNVIDKWVCYGVWPSKIEYNTGDASQNNEKVMETVTLQCDYYERG